MQASDSKTPKVRLADTAAEDGEPESLYPAPEAREGWELEDDHTWFFPPEAEPDEAAQALSLEDSGGVPVASRAVNRPVVREIAHQPQPADREVVAPESPPATPASLPPFARVETQHETGARLIVEVLSLGALLEVEKQILGRGLLLPLEQKVSLGVDLDVCVLFPNVGHEIWFFGRVVYVSAAGTAIDIQPTVHDKARWLEAATAFRSKTPFARAPGAHPFTEPPRLRPKEARPAPEPPRTDTIRTGTGVRKRRQLDAVRMESRREIREAGVNDRQKSGFAERPPTRNRSAALTARARVTERRAARKTGAVPAPSPRSGPVNAASEPAQPPSPPTGSAVATGVSVRRPRRPTGAAVPVKKPAPAKKAIPVAKWPRAPSGFYGPKFTQQLEARELRLSARNKFAVFGLHWSAYPERIRTAFEKEKALLDPAVIPKVQLLRHGNRIHAILEAYDRAWESLRYRASRRAHRSAIVSDAALTNAVAHYLEQGRGAADRGDADHAMDCLRRVIDMNPNDAEATQLLASLGETPSIDG